MTAHLSTSSPLEIADFASAAVASTARLHSRDIGTGKNVMFLHGWTCNSEDWAGQLPYFESGYRVATVNLRGHGSSEVMPSGAYSPADYVADIESLIATRYVDEPFVIAGHSVGGQIAARLAARRPEFAV